jgi:hypothetical protein
MKMNRLSVVASLSITAFFIIGVPKHADASSIVLASDNGTIQPAGPRPGTNGKAFFNTEGSGNGAFADFGVVDFLSPAGLAFGGSLSLTLTQANASFTHNGLLVFYLSTDVTTNIDPGTSTLSFNATDLPTGLDSQLATRYLLATGTFTQVADGHADVFTFMPTGAALSYLSAEISAGGKIRLIIAPDDASVAATYAGFTNSEFPGPALTISTVPEPSTFVLLAGALLIATRHRRRDSARRQHGEAIRSRCWRTAGSLRAAILE